MSMKRKFKIGDTVRMTKAISALDRLCVGKIGVVVDDSSIVGSRVKFDCGIDTVVIGCTGDQLELVKEKEKEAEMAKYKVGDLVLVVGPEDPNKISESEELSWIPGGMKKFCGRVMKICSINSHGRYLLDDGNGWCFVDAWLRKWPYGEMPRFQRGDRVRIHDHSSREGEIGTVKGITDFFGLYPVFLVGFDNPNGWTAGPDSEMMFKSFGIHGVSREDGPVYWFAAEHELIPFGEAKKKCDGGEKLKFKIGDRVIGNEKAKCYSFTKTGWVGYVTEILSDSRIRVNHKMDPKLGYVVFDDRFDPYPEEKQEKKSGTRRVVIEITEDGAKAKYIVGKKVEKEAEIRRYHEDRPDDAKAAKYAVEALFGRLKADEEAERAAKTAEVLRGMNWGDILFRAFCEGTKK